MALRELSVRNLALIERARVEFAAGFTVITGETGAGKSLLIDALSLVMGWRADSGLVRHGADGGRVEALFDLPERSPDPLICVRELSAAGRSVARIDDETVTVGRLAATVRPLVDIHGQHDQQRLLDAAWQRDVLDAFGGHADLRERVSAAVGEWRANEAALRRLAVEPAELERRIELANHALAEIEDAAPRVGEIDELRARQSRAANSERIRALVGEAHALAVGGEDAARERIALARRATDELARLDPSAQPLAERFGGLEAELEDIGFELSRRTDELAEAGLSAEQIEDRLSLLYGLLRKYGADEAALVEHAERTRTEIDELRAGADERERRAAAAAELEAAARTAAMDLRGVRRTAAGRLAAAVTDALGGLGFAAAAFQISLADALLDESGADAVTFTLAPNPGEPARPLAAIASGGELSRVALALKGVLARADRTPTLVFDEVDAGIGGRSADPVGRALWALARHHQVICITHLPQIAAYADAHLRIDKLVRDDRTVTDVTPLDAEARRAELAQMLGGGAADAGALAAADELLARAAEARAAAAAA
ncbi:MAG TPA: DNA repair protein RecN [Candidatus Limnocylindria bacterium]|nr:DNA repair protein RecN [Candidatus Limnocylindria bacterium]